MKRSAAATDGDLGVRSPASAVLERIGDWIFPPKGPEAGPVELTQRRVYILPTRAGLLFALTMVLMLIGSINYSLSLGYALTFLLTGTGLVSMLHTWRNLAHAQLRPGKSTPVFCGDRARFVVLASNPGRVARVSLAIQFGDNEPMFVDVAAGAETEARIRLPATRRGLFRPGRFRVFTMYPLGLFYAWAIVELDLACLVYPTPEAGVVPLPEQQAATGEGAALGKGEEDFAGLRNYYPGDSPRRIAWKAAARSEVFVTKLFAGAAGAEMWIDFAQTPERLGLEGRLSRLARWLVDAEGSGFRYGLRLPGKEIPLGAGGSHRGQCLEALALYRGHETPQ
ncbi:MAG: DUF58 domain-containing protein [Burkholderiales bacterium]